MVVSTRWRFLFSRVFLLFVSNLAVHDIETLAICALPGNLFTIWSLILQRAHRTATARLAVGTTFHYGTLVNLSYLCSPDHITSMFFGTPAFPVVESRPTSGAMNSAPPNQSVYPKHHWLMIFQSLVFVFFFAITKWC